MKSSTFIVISHTPSNTTGADCTPPLAVLAIRTVGLTLRETLELSSFESLGFPVYESIVGFGWSGVGQRGDGSEDDKNGLHCVVKVVTIC